MNKYSISIFLFFLFVVFVNAQTDKTYKKALKEHRKSYKKAFVENDQGPLDNKGVKKMDFYKANESFIVEAAVELTPDSKPFEMATYSGITKTYRKYATLSFEINGEPHQLAVYQNMKLMRMPMYRNRLFLPFKDATNGDDTYGGGRYIDMSTNNIVDGKIEIDFNKAYNPYCAYSDGYNCPVPPLENHLKSAILVGEKNYVE
ncbi:MAG: DUF1684 domain-containing protein [Bacteroidota bacterium]